MFPQIPFFVRQIPRPLVTLFWPSKDALLAVNASRAWMAQNKRLLMGWKLHEVEFAKLPQNLAWLGIK